MSAKNNIIIYYTQKWIKRLKYKTFTVKHLYVQKLVSSRHETRSSLFNPQKKERSIENRGINKKILNSSNTAELIIAAKTDQVTHWPNSESRVSPLSRGRTSQATVCRDDVPRRGTRCSN